MSTALRTPTEPLPARRRALKTAHDRLSAEIGRQRALLAQAHDRGDQEETERALVEITLAVQARAVAQRHLERLGIPPGGPLGKAGSQPCSV